MAFSESDKDRLYVCLHARVGGDFDCLNAEDHFHWSLLLGPKAETSSSQGTRFRVTRSTPEKPYRYEEHPVLLRPVNYLLVRITIGKVRQRDRERLLSVLRSIPISHNEEYFNSVAWVRKALETLQRDRKAVRSARLDWDFIRQRALMYCLEKTAMHRFDGRGSFDDERIATYDLLEGRETVP